MGQSYPIYACTRTNHARYSSVTFCSNWKHSFVKVILGKKLDKKKVSNTWNNIIKYLEKSRHLKRRVRKAFV